MATTNATFGSPAQGTLANNATDTYQLTANAGGVVKVDFAHPAGPGSAGKAIILTLTDLLGNVLVTQTVYGNTSFVTTVAGAGAYYLKVTDGNGSTSNDAGSYTVTPTLTTVTGVTYDGAANDTTVTAIASAMGAPITGGLIGGDVDMFKVHADSGGVLTVKFQHPNGVGTNGRAIVIDVVDAAGNVIASRSLGGDGTFVTTVTAAGDYYLKVANSNAYYDHIGTYTLTPTLSASANTTYDGAANNTTATALSSAMGAAITGGLNGNDVDVFKAHADSGGVLTLNFQHPNGVGTDGRAIVVDLVDAAGNIIATRSLNGNATVTTTVASAGDYYLKVANSNAYYDHIGTYKLTPTLSASANTTYDGAANNTTATALSSAMGAAITGGMNGGDVDVFKVHADSGGVLSLNFQHPNGAGTDGRAIVVDVVDAAGNVVASQSLNGNATFVTTVAAAGDYYLKLSNSNAYYDHIGTYSLTPTLLNQPGVVYDGGANNTTATALSAPLGTTIMGALSSGDSDYFKFSAGSSGTLNLNFSHPDGIGSNGHAISVTVLDSTGKTVLAKTEYGSDLLTATLAGGGDYYIKVTDANQYASGGRGVYKVFAGMSSNGGVNLNGTAASEKLASTAGNDFINGGLGQDTVTYQGNSGDYKINVSAVGAQVVDSLGRDGNDSLINVERLQFADKMVALDVDGVAGMAYRVYQAAFDRAPDSAGVGYWIAQMDKGLSLHDVANSFILSKEFQDKHGVGTSNKDLTTAFYTNVLHRAPDQAGLDYWVGLLDNHQVDAADVLASFSTSGENVAQLTGVLSHGISYTPYML